METVNKELVTVETTIHAPIEKVWEYFSQPKHITQWNNASDDWFTPKSENDFREGGKFVNRMEAKDGLMGFDFWGVYDKIVVNKYIEYTLGDNRKVKINFTSEDNKTRMEESFEAEATNSLDVQKTGWQNIVNNFKKYVESH